MQISEELNTIISFAREEAMRTGCYLVKADHLFLGILRHCDNQACKVLSALDANLENLKLKIEKHLFQESSIPYCDEDKIQLERGAQNALSIAVYEALRMGTECTSSIHLLLAICKSNDSISRSYLEGIDIDANTIKAYLNDIKPARKASEEKRPAPPSKPGNLKIIGTISIKPSDIYS